MLQCVTRLTTGLRFVKFCSMVDVKDLFKREDHAALYKIHRPGYMPSSAKKIIDFLAEKFNPSECEAVDVGCGSGQGTLPLAPYLRRIVGIDPSEAQINQVLADKDLPANVEFRVGEAEKLPFEDSSLQLVNVKTALHWFDIPKFFDEVDRVLQPGGVLAVGCVGGYADINGHGEEILQLVLPLAKDYRHNSAEFEERSKLMLSLFKDVKFPYEECIRDEEFYVTDKILTVRSFTEGLKTRSDMAEFLRVNPEGAEKDLKELEEKVMNIIGATGLPEETVVKSGAKQVLILCRKPQVAS